MAIIPTYTSRENPTTQPGAVNRRDESVGVALNPNSVDTELGQEAGKQLTDLSLKLMELENANAKSKTDIEITASHAAIEDKFNQNPDYTKGLEDANKEIDDLKNVASKNFKNPIARDAYLQDLELKNTIFKIGLQKSAYKKQIDVGRVNTLQEMDMEASNYINAPNESTKLASRQKITGIMDNAIKLGLFTHEQGYGEVEKMIKSADEATKDMEKLKARETKEKAWANEKAVTEEEKSFVSMLTVGKDKFGMPISRRDLIVMAEKNNTISKDFKKLLINAAISPKTADSKTKDGTFNSLAGKILSPTSDPKKVRDEILAKNGTLELSDEDFGILSVFNEKIDKGTLDKMLPDKGPLQAVSWWSDENAGKRQDVKARLFKRYMVKINNGEDSILALEESIKEEILILHPQAKTYPKEGKKIMDVSGVFKRILPTLEIKDEETTGDAD